MFLGYPENCHSDDEKAQFVQALRKDCGFESELQKQHIKFNPAGVTVAKLSANALVGKLGKKNFLSFCFKRKSTVLYKAYLKR